MKLASVAVFAGLLIASTVHAQNVVMMNSNGTMPSFGRAGTGLDHTQTITINFQFNMPTKPPATDADVTRTMAEASQSLYGIVDQECTILAASLKGNCRLVQMNIGGNINNRGNPVYTVAANAMATFEITPILVAEPITPK